MIAFATQLQVLKSLIHEMIGELMASIISRNLDAGSKISCIWHNLNEQLNY